MESNWHISLAAFLFDLCNWLDSTWRDFISDMMEHQTFVMALAWALFVSLLLAPSYPAAGFLVPVTGFMFLLGYVFSDIRRRLRKEECDAS